MIGLVVGRPETAAVIAERGNSSPVSASFMMRQDDLLARRMAKPELAVPPQAEAPARPLDFGRPAADREWFERVVVSLLSDLYGTALRLTRKRQDAEDLVADTVARAWSHLDELEDRSRLRGWLFRILTNAFLSGRRAEARHGVEEPLDDAADDGFSLFEQLHVPVLLLWSSPEKEFLDKLLREDLARSVDALRAHRLHE